MAARKFDLIAFDWDGTLIDSTSLIATSLQEAARDLGLAVPTREEASHVIGLGLMQAFAWLWPDLEPGRHPALLERYRYHFLGRDKDVNLFPGVREMLAALRAEGYLLTVATGKARQGLIRALEQAGLTGFFDATRCADETASKPDPMMLLELIEEFDVAPERVLMVGDTTHDLQMARNAGTAAVAVSCGAHPLSELQREPYLAILDEVGALPEWLACHA
ncbi:MAG: HAD-IA family hydrolase [Rhodocyclaceae bacterium]